MRISSILVRETQRACSRELSTGITSCVCLLGDGSSVPITNFHRDDRSKIGNTCDSDSCGLVDRTTFTINDIIVQHNDFGLVVFKRCISPWININTVTVQCNTHGISARYVIVVDIQLIPEVDVLSSSQQVNRGDALLLTEGGSYRRACGWHIIRAVDGYHHVNRSCTIFRNNSKCICWCNTGTKLLNHQIGVVQHVGPRPRRANRECAISATDIRLWLNLIFTRIKISNIQRTIGLKRSVLSHAASGVSGDCGRGVIGTRDCYRCSLVNRTASTINNVIADGNDLLLRVSQVCI